MFAATDYLRRDRIEAECGRLLSAYPEKLGSRVRIPLSPPSQTGGLTRMFLDLIQQNQINSVDRTASNLQRRVINIEADLRKSSDENP